MSLYLFIVTLNKNYEYISLYMNEVLMFYNIFLLTQSTKAQGQSFSELLHFAHGTSAFFSHCHACKGTIYILNILKIY